MAITKEKKVAISAKLDSIKNDASAVVFVRFNGVSGTDMTEMREDLRARGVEYFVAKKTLMKRAFADHYTGTMPELEGEIAVAYSTDTMAPAQVIKEYTGKFKDNLAIVGGMFQGAYKNAEEMTEIASIPALPILRGMFVNVINSPIQGLAVVTSAIAEKRS